MLWHIRKVTNVDQPANLSNPYPVIVQLWDSDSPTDPDVVYTLLKFDKSSQLDTSDTLAKLVLAGYTPNDWTP